MAVVTNYDMQLLQSVTGITKCDRKILQSLVGITKCDKKLLQNVTVITKCGNYYRVKRNRAQLWLEPYSL